MSNTIRLVVVLLCASLVGGVGCRSKEPAAPAPKATKTGEGPLLAPPQQPAGAATPQGDPSEKANSGDAAKPAGDETAEADKIKASFALLSNEDRAIAEKQKICPVSGEKLGTMGAAKKISVAGHDVFICCKSCEDPLTKDPAKFLAKIGLEPKK